MNEDERREKVRERSEWGVEREVNGSGNERLGKKKRERTKKNRQKGRKEIGDA